MTTPKKALELKPCPFCGGADVEAVDSLDFVSCQNCGASLEDSEPSARELWNTRATPSLQGEDAVERVARIIDPQAWRDRDYYDDYRRLPASEHHATKSSITKARATLATGLVAGEAAIRADEREKQKERDAKIAEACFIQSAEETEHSLACKDIAAAIRSGGVK